MADICTCGHDESLHIARNLVTTLGIRYRPCRRIGCDCTEFDPAPAGVSAAPTTRDRPIGPAGAPIPTTSEEQCETCHRLLSCVGTCPKGCEQ